MTFIKYKSIIVAFCCFLTLCGGCKKMVEVPEPVNTITTIETFSSDATATSAVAAIYNDMIAGGPGRNFAFANGATTINAGMSADELHHFGYVSLFETNTLNATDFPGITWTAPYYDIYIANGVIENLPGSPGVSDAVKTRLTGEAEFFRAFCYFYLVNMFGDVPLVTTTAWAHTDTLHRSPVELIYQQIMNDLSDAQTRLPEDYTVSNGQRITVNKFAASALLARVYLYTKNWAGAVTQASNVLTASGLYGLVSDLNQVFLANSQEAILQLQVGNYYPYTTREGHSIIPYDSTANPSYYLSDQLLADFEPGDQRRFAWIDSTDYNGTLYYYPYKYKEYVGSDGDIKEYYMMLRLSEQYLIRAEANAQLNNLSDAIADLNVIRERAGLADLPNTLNQSEVLAAVAHERRIELFTEWGHRWMDLKRTGQADAVIGAIKPTWKSNAQLYPIPASELIADPNLTQNPGY